MVRSIRNLYLRRVLTGLTGSVDGSLSTLTYVDEAAFKRLHLLQGQLIRTVQHVAALNPKAFRWVAQSYLYAQPGC